MAACPGHRDDQAVTLMTLDGNRPPRDTHPTLYMTGTQMLVAPHERGPQAAWWEMLPMDAVLVKCVFVSGLLFPYPLPLQNPYLIPNVNVLYCEFLSQRVCEQFRHPRCVSVKLCDVGTKVEVVQTFKLQDES